MAARPPARIGNASSIGKPPARGAVVAVVVVVEVVVEAPGTNGVGVRKRNGVGVARAWATVDCATVSGPAANATPTRTVIQMASINAAPATKRPASALLVAIIVAILPC